MAALVDRKPLAQLQTLSRRPVQLVFRRITGLIENTVEGNVVLHTATALFAKTESLQG